MRAFAISLALTIGIAAHAAAQTPADLARLAPQGAHAAISVAPRIAADGGAFGPRSLARLDGRAEAEASSNAAPGRVYAQAFGAADLARLRGGGVAAWHAAPPALDRLAASMAGGARVQ